MSILAMAPPVSIGGKILVALLLLGLVGILSRAIRGASFTGRSIRLSIGVTVGVLVVLEALLPSSFGGGFHDRGVLAAIVGACSGAGLFRPAGRGGHARTSSTRSLAAIAFITGPLMGLVLASLTVLLTDVSPLDRGYTFGVFTMIGLLAGLIGAVVVGIASALGSFRSSESDRHA